MKDCFVQRKTMLMCLGFVVFYGFLSMAGSFPVSTLVGIGMMMGFSIPMNSFSYDEQVKWDTFAAMTPGGRRNVVFGKYLFMLLITLGCGGVTVLLVGGLTALNLIEASFLETIFTIGACTIVCLLLSSITLPVFFKFGAAKSRMIYMLIFAVVFGGGVFLLSFLNSSGVTLPEPSEMDVLIFLLAFCAAAVLMMAASVFLSLRIYKKKEF